MRRKSSTFLYSFIVFFSEDLYQDLKSHLFESHLDKDANVRAQAVTALCRLQSDNEVNPSDGQTILDKLMWSVRHDPSA